MRGLHDSQSSRILSALRSGRRLSALEALEEFGCFRLAARIHDLRRAGHEILDETVCDNGKRHAVYHLVSVKQLQLADFGSPNARY